MSNDPTNIILDYMKSLRNSMMGVETTRLSSSIKTGLSVVKRMIAFHELDTADFFSQVGVVISSLRKEGAEVENISKEVQEAMKETQRLITESDFMLPSFNEKPEFYSFFLQHMDVFETADEEYRKVREYYLKMENNKKPIKTKKIRKGYSRRSKQNINRTLNN